MTTRGNERAQLGAVEIHCFSGECRTSILPKLHVALAASNCWLAGTKYGRYSSEYHFEMELASVLDLYCGLVDTGLQMTELTHRTLTQLCMLRMNGRVLGSDAPENEGRVIEMRLSMTFIEMEEGLPGWMGASAQGC